MNYLGHAYLSFSHEGILIGNMISDFVKGKKQYDYPLPIQKGIQLHRAIDAFTDQHLAVKAISAYFKPTYKLYAYPITDIVLDYFLANDKENFPVPGALQSFAMGVYSTLKSNELYFPEKFEKMFPYMQAQDWLYNYQHNWGIEKSLQGLMHRATYLEEMNTAYEIFLTNKEIFQQHYDQCFPSVKNFAIQTLNTLLNN